MSRTRPKPHTVSHSGVLFRRPLYFGLGRGLDSPQSYEWAWPRAIRRVVIHLSRRVYKVQDMPGKRSTRVETAASLLSSSSFSSSSSSSSASSSSLASYPNARLHFFPQSHARAQGWIAQPLVFGVLFDEDRRCYEERRYGNCVSPRGGGSRRRTRGWSGSESRARWRQGVRERGAGPSRWVRARLLSALLTHSLGQWFPKKGSVNPWGPYFIARVGLHKVIPVYLGVQAPKPTQI